jgi:photosystem II stability/assembly factor-like uncharacterized protein
MKKSYSQTGYKQIFILINIFIICLIFCVYFIQCTKESNPAEPETTTLRKFEEPSYFWQRTSIPYSGLVFSICMNSRKEVYVKTSSRLYLLNNNGSSFTVLDSATNTKNLAINSHDYLFLSTGYSEIYRSLDNGKTWQNIKIMTSPFFFIDFSFISIDKNDIIFAGGDNYIYRSADNGETWVQKKQGLENGNIFCMAINKNNDLFVCSGGESFLSGSYRKSSNTRGIPGYEYCIYKSTDNGDNWKKLCSNDFSLTCLAIDSAGNIYGGAWDYGITYSKDNGETWEKTGDNLPNKYINSIIFNSAGKMFAGTSTHNGIEGGVFTSTDMGKTWTKINSGMTKNIYGDVDIRCLFIDSKGYLYAGTAGNGVYRSSEPVN